MYRYYSYSISVLWNLSIYIKPQYTATVYLYFGHLARGHRTLDVNTRKVLTPRVQVVVADSEHGGVTSTQVELS